MYFRAFKFCQQICLLFLDDGKHYQACNQDIHCQTQCSKCLKLSLDLLDNIRVSCKDTHLTRTGRGMLTFNIHFNSCEPSLLCILVNPLLNCTLCNVTKKLGLIMDQSVCNRLHRPVNLTCHIINICPEKWMVPIGAFVLTLFHTASFPILL